MRKLKQEDRNWGLVLFVTSVVSRGHLAYACIQSWLSGSPCICLCSQSPFPLEAQYYGDRNYLHGVWKSSEADCYNSKIIFKNKRLWDSVLASPFLRQIPVVFLSEHKETMELVKYLWSNFFFLLCGLDPVGGILIIHNCSCSAGDLIISSILQLLDKYYFKK